MAGKGNVDRAPEIRFPFEALKAQFPEYFQDDAAIDKPGREQLSELPCRARFADRLGVTRHVLGSWEDKGSLQAASADRAAVALGMHPMSIWPEEWWAYLERAL